MKKKTLIALLAVLALLGAVLLLKGRKQDRPLEGNLIANGDFAAVSSGMPEGWGTGMWVTSPGASFLEAAEIDGRHAVLVENAAPNDARFEQRVTVRPGSTLRLSASVRAEGCGEGMGANVSFLGVYGASEDLHDTGGAWKRLEVYGRTGEDMREVTVCLRLGGYGSENTGRAWFTDVRLEEVDEAPVGAAYVNLATPKPAREEPEKTGDLKGAAIPLLLLGAAAYLALGYAVLSGRVTLRGRRALPALLLAAFALRLIPAVTVKGYGVDMGCFSAWAGRMASLGPAGFYAEDYFCDYPPAYMLVLGLIGHIANLFQIDYSGMGMQTLLKLAPILCDLALAVLAYRLVRRMAGETSALAAACLLALNPAYIITGSCWGQIDSVTALLLVLVLTRAREGDWPRAIPLFALAVLTKPQAGLLAPLGVAALTKDLAAGRKGGEKRGRAMLRGIGFGLLLTLAVVLPFSLRQANPLWLVERYTSTLGSYNYASLSTGNLMFLLGGNWKEMATPLPGGVTYGQLGTALMVLAFAVGLFCYLRGEGRSALWLSAALTLQLVFVLGVKMHERYIVPALALLLLAAFETKDIRLFASFALASAATAVNVGVVLAFEYLIAPNLWLGYALGVCQLAAAALSCWAAADLCVLRRPAKVWTPKRREPQAQQPAGTGEERLRDLLLGGEVSRRPATAKGIAAMLAVTAVYAAVAFYDLGAVKAPQTGYVSSAGGESVVLDLGETREDFHIYYYGGISDTQFDFSVSEDGERWEPETRAYFDRGECFKWQALRRPILNGEGTATGASGGMLAFTGRYLRVTFEGAGSSLWEVAAVDGSGSPYPVTAVSASGALDGRADDPEKLTDEQDAVPAKPTYQNSMYFDEIYHARTGYEHAHSLSTYETTHPPLGKDLMALCIHLLGMTPFAWRLAGCLAGILMLPVIWLLGWELLGSQRWALFAEVLFALDCMHFTQTRIATIDSFPVLFMMLMFLFMARWRRMDFFGARFGRTLLPLFLSGLCMGLAIASKWIGCYGAVGLALLFFARFIALLRAWRYACAHREEQEMARAADLFPKRAVITLACCVAFFVVIPIAVYCLSYVPYLSYYGKVQWDARTFKRIWDAQVLMYDYHKNLVAEHYFASPWYEWPVIGKPMWYYNADYAVPGKASSILAFGNPAIWWTGLAAILFALMEWARVFCLPLLGSRAAEEEDLPALSGIAVGFLSAYLPWVLVSRLTFIYHYFASVPFIILATAYLFQRLERTKPRVARIAAALLAAAALALFIGFYPLASGCEVAREWCEAMNWFPGWMWF